MMDLREIIFGKPYFIGQGVIVSPGDESDPPWFQGQKRLPARIAKEIPGQKRQPALVIEFDTPVEIDGYSARFVVVERRTLFSKGQGGESFPLEVCDFMPEDKPWKDRRQGRRIEFDATFTLDIK